MGTEKADYFLNELFYIAHKERSVERITGVELQDGWGLDYARHFRYLLERETGDRDATEGSHIIIGNGYGGGE